MTKMIFILKSECLRVMDKETGGNVSTLFCFQIFLSMWVMVLRINMKVHIMKRRLFTCPKIKGILLDFPALKR